MKMRWTLLSALILSSTLPLLSGTQHQHMREAESFEEAGEKLGEVSFPISCAPEAQKRFERAVALLHSFQYRAAENGFLEVARKDPPCAMAYWGQAMSLYHQLWEHPNRETLKKGWSEIERAEAGAARAEREREYIAAAAAFYQNPEKDDYESRATSYSKAMEAVYQHNPQDGEAAAFYALSLVALPVHGDQELANRKKAIAILNKLFAEETDHPGAAHYLIHAADTPQLASLGLDAARSYARIAPSSAHALHMPSHIFTRLGLWQESIQSNLASAVAAKQATLAHAGDASYQIHAMDFLEYAYLQTGREREARRLIEQLKSVPGVTKEQLAANEARFMSRQALETRHWKEAAGLLPSPDKSPGVQAPAYWGRTIGAARAGDLAGARLGLRKLDDLRTRMQGKKQEYGSHPFGTECEEAAAWLAFAEGKAEEALKELRATAEREEAEGLDSLVIPAREMLGDMLLEAKRPEQALTEFEAALKMTPNRFDGLYGAARAAQLAGNAARATGYYVELRAISDHASGNRPELQEAKLFLARQ